MPGKALRYVNIDTYIVKLKLDFLKEVEKIVARAAGKSDGRLPHASIDAIVTADEAIYRATLKNLGSSEDKRKFEQQWGKFVRESGCYRLDEKPNAQSCQSAVAALISKATIELKQTQSSVLAKVAPELPQRRDATKTAPVVVKDFNKTNSVKSRWGWGSSNWFPKRVTVVNNNPSDTSSSPKRKGP